eukprot:TRINITY_DN75747_c0_g1_i1.p1 TRINITY_DN75747_c0_g1~~TRINITY_DN75747_c0_g1_i1.p1  ORF type:complete len:1052 (-),score=231.82 TRINITY_DN75747_c0_g1_i1:58-3213(-)
MKVKLEGPSSTAASSGDDDDGEDHSPMICRKKTNSETIRKESKRRPIAVAKQVLQVAAQANAALLADADQHVLKHKTGMGKNPTQKKQIMAALDRDPFCRCLDKQSKEVLIEIAVHVEFSPGETVVKEGEPGQYFFVVHEGKLQVSNSRGSVINTMEAGSTFGDKALMYGCPRTATVAVSADKPAGLFAVHGDEFRQVVSEHWMKNLADTRQFLENMNSFDGLSTKQKDLVAELFITSEVPKETRVLTQDEVASAIYFVKQGSLSFVTGGAVDEATGHLKGGRKIGQLGPGDCFGWRSQLTDEQLKKERCTVVAETDCQLASVGVTTLMSVLGEDFIDGLEQSFVLLIIRHMPLLDILDSQQRFSIASTCDIRRYEHGESVEGDVRLAIIADGEAEGVDAEDQKLILHRGHWCQDEELERLCQAPGAQLKPTLQGEKYYSPAKLKSGLVAGPTGCRIATLTKDGLARALRARAPSKQPAEILVVNTNEDVVYLRKIVLARRVPLFKELSEGQVLGLVEALKLKVYKKDDAIITQGEIGHHFFVTASGEMKVTVDGKVVRKLGQDTCFGERALLFNERRSATVEVASETAEVWSIGRQAFERIITGNMRDSLMQTIRLQDKSFTMKDLKHKRFIGAGSFGTVRLVEHKRTGVRYALKRIRKEGDGIPEEVIQEIAILEEFDHPFILRMVTTFEGNNSVYILTELITGGNLYEEVVLKMKVLNRKCAQFYIGSLILILEVIHEKGIVYRDLKPENVMLDAQGYLKLVDFGVAKKLDEKFQRTFTLVGTAAYMAPEVIRGRGYGTECDVWSLGVMLYELVCGKLPFGDDTDDDRIMCSAILNEQLEFPASYQDSAGKRLIAGLLDKQPMRRLGVMGHQGWEDVKENRFFKQGQNELFSAITGRELTAPLVPTQETYSDDSFLEECTMSDAEELGQHEAKDVSCRVVSCFQEFDLSSESQVTRQEIGAVLNQLNPDFWTNEKIDKLMKAVDKRSSGKACVQDFMKYLFSGDDDEVVSEFYKACELDTHSGLKSTEGKTSRARTMRSAGTRMVRSQ